MTQGWGKSLLFKIAIGAVVLFVLLSCMGTAGASDIVIDPPSIDVSFSFDQPRDTAHYETLRIFTIRNTNSDPNSTISGDIGSISGNINIIPSHPSFSLHGGESVSVSFTIEASPSTPAGSHPFTINVGEESIIVSVRITYCAKIEVSRYLIDFGRVPRTANPVETITLSEKLGYKDVNIQMEKKTGNDWVVIENPPTQIKKDSSVEIKFKLTPRMPDHNEYSWTFSLSTTTSHTEISPSSIHIEAYILMPPKLGKLHDEELEIKFDKPKGTVSKYDRYIDVRVRNEGDEAMYFNSWFTEYPSGITIKIENPSGSVSGKSSENIGLHVIAPYDAPEGTYYGRLYIDAGGAGHGNVVITIVVKWPVDFIISSTSIYFTPPPPLLLILGL